MERSSWQSSARLWRAELESPAAREIEHGRAVEVAGASQCGRRHQENEDQYLVAELERSMFVRCSGLTPGGVGGSDVAQGHVFMVADGVGGREGGRLASSIVVESMAAYVLTSMPWTRRSGAEDTPQFAETLESALKQVQQRMRQEARVRDIDPRLGTTLTMAYVVWPCLYLAHAGDSRSYVSRGEELHRLTRDHTVAQALLDATGDLDRRAVEARWGHVLDNVIGGATDDLHVDARIFELESGDRLLLCTDGLTAYLDDETLRSRLCERRPVEEVAENLVRTAYDSGGHDDITVILAQF